MQGADLDWESKEGSLSVTWGFPWHVWVAPGGPGLPATEETYKKVSSLKAAEWPRAEQRAWAKGNGTGSARWGF